ADGELGNNTKGHARALRLSGSGPARNVTTDAAMPRTFQYGSGRHQAQTAITGMWAFLASEMLFFGVLFLAWIVCRHWNQAGFDAGARQTGLVFGTVNTIVLVTSSLAYTAGATFVEAGNTRRLIQ